MDESKLTLLISLATIVACGVIAFNIRDYRGRNLMALGIENVIEQIRQLRFLFTPRSVAQENQIRATPSGKLIVCPQCGYPKHECKDLCWHCGFEVSTSSIEIDPNVNDRSRCPTCGKWKPANRACPTCN